MDGEAPKPFAQSCQYQKIFKAAKADDEDPPKKGKGKAKKGKPRKLRADIKNVPAPVQESHVSEGSDMYKAKEYASIRRQFMNQVRDELGLSAKEAGDQWNQSSQKRKILATLSVPELRRRRFIDKGCHHNPWVEDASN